MPLRPFDISSIAGVLSDPKNAVQGVGIFSSIAGAYSSSGPRMKTIAPAMMGTRITKMMLSGLSMKLGAGRGGLSACVEVIEVVSMIVANCALHFG